jgi:hypothetical protein
MLADNSGNIFVDGDMDITITVDGSAVTNLYNSTTPVSGTVNKVAPVLAGTATVTTVGGVATFPGLSMVAAGDNFKLVATSKNGALKSSSNAFSIQVGPCQTLIFTQVPKFAAINSTLPTDVVVECRDAGNYTDVTATYTAQVDLEAGVASVSAAPKIQGNTVAVMTQGRAVFPGLSVNSLQKQLTLSTWATTPGLESQSSSPFSVLTPSAFLIAQNTGADPDDAPAAPAVDNTYIIIGAAVGALLLMCGLYYLYRRRSLSSGDDNNNKVIPETDGMQMSEYSIVPMDGLQSSSSDDTVISIPLTSMDDLASTSRSQDENSRDDSSVALNLPTSSDLMFGSPLEVKVQATSKKASNSSMPMGSGIVHDLEISTSSSDDDDSDSDSDSDDNKASNNASKKKGANTTGRLSTSAMTTKKSSNIASKATAKASVAKTSAVAPALKSKASISASVSNSTSSSASSASSALSASVASSKGATTTGIKPVATTKSNNNNQSNAKSTVRMPGSIPYNDGLSDSKTSSSSSSSSSSSDSDD